MESLTHSIDCQFIYKHDELFSCLDEIENWVNNAIAYEVFHDNFVII